MLFNVILDAGLVISVMNEGKFFVFFSICFEWACQDFKLLKANLGPLCIPHPGIGPLV